MSDSIRSQMVKPAVAALVTTLVGLLWHFTLKPEDTDTSLATILLPAAGAAIAVWILGRQRRPPSD